MLINPQAPAVAVRCIHRENQATEVINFVVLKNEQHRHVQSLDTLPFLHSLSPSF